MTIERIGVPAADQTYAADVPELVVEWDAEPVAGPRLVLANDALAADLGIDVDWLHSDAGLATLAGNRPLEGVATIAQVYAGHQFGSYSPRLGDGRALLLGELVDGSGRRVDLQLKGSGRTPFARGGDGKAVIGPMLREYVVGEAMHALGVPTTRMLAVVATGEDVARETLLPGAVLTRVASSHLRVGTFQFAASTGDLDVLRRLTDHAIRRHHPDAADADVPALALFDAVLAAQVETVSHWMALGFVHGVMNTDNVTISGETIDYGPCAFMEAYDPRTVFSSIDHGGRYAYGNQPAITAWNLARFAETLVPLVDDDADRAVALLTERLEGFGERFHRRWHGRMAAKLGVPADEPDSERLVEELLELMHAQRADWTATFRFLAGTLRSDSPTPAPTEGGRLQAATSLTGPAADAWTDRWWALLAGRAFDEVADEIDAVNPIVIPRNHLVEEALELATRGAIDPVERLVRAVSAPFRPPVDERYALPAPADFGRYRTFCGT